MSESLSEDGFSLIYFSWNYLNICYARGRNKERGIAQVRTVQLGPAPGAVNLSWGSLVTGRCLLENDTVEPRLMFSVFQSGLPDPHPDERGFGGLAGAELIGH